ncbi:MAG: dihydroorotase family protein [Candidatus Peregrinibacteria bacterium]
MKNVFIKGGTLVTAKGEERADIFIGDGIISKIISHEEPITNNQKPKTGMGKVVDATGLLLFPGLIDCHVHFREPGLTHKGDMRSESRSALAGGVTTVCDMPNTVPPTVTVEALRDKVKRAEKISDCDIRFFFGVTKKSHLQEFKKAWGTPLLRSRLAGLKVYFDHSTGDQRADMTTIEEAFRICAELHAPLVAHCEDAVINAEASAMIQHAFSEGRSSDVSFHSLMRPTAAEVRAIEQGLDFVRKYGTAFHIAHLSTAQGLDLVRKAKKEGLPVTCEIAPHHLFLMTSDYASLGTFGKMNPPLRTPDQQRFLWEGVMDGTVDCIATDHAPHTLEEKKNPDWQKAPGGVPGVETMLPLLLTVAAGGWPHPSHLKAHRSKLKAQDIVRLCFENPNRIFKLGKQGIQEGAPADIVVVDPSKEWVIHGKELSARCGWTPYEGWKVWGRTERAET